MKSAHFICILLMYFAALCGANLMASKGYFASSSPIRSFLISSGLGRAIHGSGLKMYDFSGFRQTGDAGTNIRKAVMKRHQIIETNNVFQKRKSEQELSLPDSPPSRKSSEQLFGALTQMDKKSCISKLLCEIGAEPSAYGMIGLKIKHYIRSVPPVTWNSATFPYLEAFNAGLKGDKSVCQNNFSSCTYNLNQMIALFSMFSHPLFK